MPLGSERQPPPARFSADLMAAFEPEPQPQPSPPQQQRPPELGKPTVGPQCLLRPAQQIGECTRGGNRQGQRQRGG